MDIQKIGVIGVGNMGSMLSLLLAENGLDVSICDLSPFNLQQAVNKAKVAGLESKVHPFGDLASLSLSLGSPKVFIFSLPHGLAGDSVVRALQPFLTKGDIVIDGSNENYQVTQRRQGVLQSRGVFYIGMGISGGYEGARHGPSLSPGGDDCAFGRLLPLLQRIAAKDSLGRPCVTKIGPGGSGHYVKMIHNGIEHGVMGVLSEAWALMNRSLKMDGQEIGDVFEKWNSEGGLKTNFLVKISAPICRSKDPNGSGYILDDIKDTVVQDANESEGTGVWANVESINRHVPNPTLAAAHHWRILSADGAYRELVEERMSGLFPSEPIDMNAKEKSVFLQDLHKAVYGAVLSCFVQGLTLLAKADKEEAWGIDFVSVMRIWRAGCIIRSDYILDLLEREYAQQPNRNPLLWEAIAGELRPCCQSLKKVVIKGLDANAHMPCLGASLEYLKSYGSTDLPTSFMEAQLDYFGAHGFDRKSESKGTIAKGKHQGAWIFP